jgi:amino acid permease
MWAAEQDLPVATSAILLKVECFCIVGLLLYREIGELALVLMLPRYEMNEMILNTNFFLHLYLLHLGTSQHTQSKQSDKNKNKKQKTKNKKQKTKNKKQKTKNKKQKTKNKIQNTKTNTDSLEEILDSWIKLRSFLNELRKVIHDNFVI